MNRNIPAPSPLSSLPKQRKVFIKTYGCQMNVYDSQRMQDSLDAEGYATADTIEDADLILLNTCYIREKSVEKLYSDLGRLRVLARTTQDREIKIGVTGCIAQAEGEEIFRQMPLVDLIVGPQTYHQLPQILQKINQGEKVIAIDYGAEDKFDHLPAPKSERTSQRGVSAFLTIQEGCDKFCTFCVVPYTRGAEASRPVMQIIQEAEQLVASGVSELTLLGQNVNNWHGQGSDGRIWKFGELLFCLAKIPQLKRLRYTTSHPRDMDDHLIAAHRDLPILMPYLHLPIQSGSDKILKAMNRRHTTADYLRVIEKIRAARPDIALSGDFIVGFPGETDADFLKTMQLIRTIFYSSAYSFKYSARPGTPAASLENQIGEAKKNERLQELQGLLNTQQSQFLQEKTGHVIDVLIEKNGRHEGQKIGRSPWLFPVAVKTQAPIGQTIPVIIQKAERNSLIGTEVTVNA